MSNDDQPIEEQVTRHCANCQRQVVPLPRGNCPTCGRILPGGVFNRKGPASMVRRDEILIEIVAEYRPQTAIHKMRCLHLASAYAQLESTVAGTPAWQRLNADSQKLVAELNATRRDSPTASAPIEALSNEALISRLEMLLAAARGQDAAAVDPAFRRSDLDDAGHMGLAPQNIHKSAGVADPETGAAEPEEPRSDQSEPLGRSIATAPAPLAADSKSAVSGSSVPLRTTSPPPISEEERERKAAAIRKELGWDRGVLNESTGIYRNRE